MEEGDVITYWPALCGNNSEASAFWNSDLTWSTNDPDLTWCFQDSVLVWLPCGYLLVAALLYIPYLSTVPRCNKIVDISWLCVAKLVTCCFLVLVGFISSIKATSGKDVPPVEILAPSILTISFVLSAVIIWLEFSRAVQSSSILIIFWLLQLLLGIIPFRSYIIHSYSEERKFHLVIFYMEYSLYVILFVLHCLKDPELDPKHTYSGERAYLLTKDEVNTETKGDKDEVKLKPCPETSANLISRICFSWISRLIIDGFRRPLIFGDLWALKKKDTTATIAPRCMDVWERHVKERRWQMIIKKDNPTRNSAGDGSLGSTELTHEEGPPLPLVSKEMKKGPQPSFWKILIFVFGPTYMLGSLFKLCGDIIGLINPQILSLLITFVAVGDPFQWHGYVYAILLFAASAMRTLFSNHQMLISNEVGMRVRTAIITMIYRKALVMNSTAKKTSTVGEIVNLMMVDTERILSLDLNFLWSIPMTLTLGVYFVWQELGAATLGGIAILLLLVPLNTWLSIQIQIEQKKQMKLKDTRLKLMNEVLNGMKMLKLYAWEESFQERLSKIREQELQTLRTMAFLNAVVGFSWSMAPYIVGLASFAVFVLMSPDNVLDANKAFVSLSLFNVMNQVLTTIPGIIHSGVPALVSIKRVSNFLLNEELDPDNVIQDPQDGDGIKMSKASFSWGNKDKAIFKEINLSIPDGKLVAIVGSMGSGKSSLLSAILGEMEVTAGKVHRRGSVAYVPQQAWIQNATVKDNILFGHPHHQSKYKKVIDACALGTDLHILPAGDMTEIGGQGIDLSGGQKQRVSLARAVYQNNDIYLLDDPLSAVDVHVGKHIFDNVIGPQGILGEKTRVFVTNDLTYLPQVDTIIVLKDGQVSEEGSYQQLLKNNGAFAEILTQYLKNNDEDEDKQLREVHDGPHKQVSEMSGTATASASVAEVGSNEQQLKGIFSKTNMHAGEGRSINQALLGVETPETGIVKLSVVKDYAKFYGLMYVGLTLGCFMVYLAAQIYANIWLSEWANDPPAINGTQDTAQRDLRLGVYGGMGLLQCLSNLGQAIVVSLGTVQASRISHSGLLKAVLRAPMSFFDTNPHGRILNRFGKDIDTIDFNLLLTLKVILTLSTGVFTTIFIIMYSTPVFIFAFIPLAIFYFLVQRFYIASSRQLQRVVSVRRSPLYNHFGDTVSGSSTIRAYEVNDRFVDFSDRLTDAYNIVYYPYIVAERWLGINLEMIGNLIVLFAAVFAVTGSVDAGTAGLSVTYALQVTSQLSVVVTLICDMENYFVAIERVKEYSDCPQEALAVINDSGPDTDWPQHGHVTFQQYSTHYRPGLDLVLRKVDCSFKPGERVGIVGRTGAGKSSLTLALFRILESVSGSIIIDGQKISEMGLDNLRSKLTIIPQDPVLFSGTLRMNLDPFETKSDDELWECMELSHLKSYVESLPEKLEHQCTEGGENFSVGIRQLVCLARALLRKTRILVMDEATAAVDRATDDVIQTTIRAEFKDCTVITIAHHLTTIMDSDRIAVMDNGNISEFASPTELLGNKNSVFYGMVREAGLL